MLQGGQVVTTGTARCIKLGCFTNYLEYYTF
jgi:hypothetical protein